LPGGGGVAQHGIAERATHAVEDRCAQQERLNTFGLPLQDFFKQIVQYEMMAASERLDETGGVVLSLK
jgi:hypothetical protein